MQKVSLSIVEYLNAKPFLQGIQKYIPDLCTVSLDTPAVCAAKVIQQQVDMGLIPVAVIPSLHPSATIITDYCIGAVGAVRSVKLFSRVPKEKIKKIYLDYQSRTSVNLIKIIAQKFWQLDFEWIKASQGYEKLIDTNTAAIIIGDRALDIENDFPYSYDLSEEWHKYTGLPFIFACWVANKKLDDNFLVQFNNALKWGVDNRLNVLAAETPNYSSLAHYLQSSISFELDNDKKKGLELFWQYLQEI